MGKPQKPRTDSSGAVMLVGGLIKYYAVTDAFMGSGIETWFTNHLNYIPGFQELGVAPFYEGMPASAKVAAIGFMIFGCGVEMAGITRDDLRRQAESSARAAVEFELAMTEIARRENIQFTDAELEEKYTQMSALYGMTPDQLKQSLPIERLTHDLRLARARAIIVDSAKQI